MHKTLPNEGKLLYEMLFPGHSLPEDFVPRYSAALHALNLVEHPEQAGLNRLLEDGADLEAAEAYLRSRAAGNLLTVKCRLISYLAETSRNNYDLFVNEKPEHWLFTSCCGVTYVLRTICKRLKGKYYAAKYRL